MKRIWVLCLLPLLLCGCTSKRAEERLAEFSEGLETVRFQASVRMEYSDRTLEYTLCYEGDAEEESVTVLAPEALSGLRMHRAKGSTALCYDGLRLEVGEIRSNEMSPAEVLPLLVSALRCPYVEAVRSEQGEMVYTLTLPQGGSAELWFAEEMRPIHAELTREGHTAAVCELTDWR